MKKYILFILIIIVFFIVKKSDDNNITKDAIRFRVIANSDAPKDIYMKEIVVSELSDLLFKNDNLSDTRNNIIKNLSVIEEKINNVFINNDYDKSYNILYGMNEFPEKEYNGIKYEEGLYESLVIEIGNGEGSNYWCFLYPSLCMIDFKKNNSNFKYKSKISEIIDNLF